MGVTRREVIATLENPAIVYEQSDKPGTMVALGGKLCVPHNPVDRTVITVVWRSHQWLPDRNTPPEVRVSGWVNLDAKEAEKLLIAWGFVVAEEKSQSKLWTHPHDPEKRLIPFSNPNRGSRANGKSSYRTAAQVVGVPVARFTQGVDKGALDRLATAFLASEVDQLDAIKAGPDPLGINSVVRSQRAAEALQTAITPPREVEAPVERAELRGRDGKVFSHKALDAVSTAVALEPVTQNEVIALTGMSKNTVERVLFYLLDEGKVARRLAAKNEVPLPGRAPYLYYAGDTVPERKSAPLVEPPKQITVEEAIEEITIEEVAAAATPQPEEQPVPATVIDLNTAPPAPPVQADARIYEDTGMPWPDGGVVLRDVDGRLWVAQPLVVGK